ncbi:hypothetical protein FSP39_010622 [Pinctada imbricata]|uniref:THAP-type domain-containing protein n=1 Tax=Pinctada imbricata TaxID=66713 RepID=A0AA88YMU9_PINIB|nr:hypothetical protein FSP39_010622 [Pinctada imbricata]
MPSNCCCVPGCHERGGHVFPSNITGKKEWIVAIKRLDEEDKTKLWQPSKSAVVCKKHFTADDYVTDTIKGNHNLIK